MVLLVASPIGLAQDPDAGSALRDLQQPSVSLPSPEQATVLTLPEDAPRESLPADVFVTVEGFTIEGNVALATADLEAL